MGNSGSKKLNKNCADNNSSKQNENYVESTDNITHADIVEENKIRRALIVQRYIDNIQKTLNKYIIPESIVALCFDYYYCIGFPLDYNLSVSDFTCLGEMKGNCEVSKNDNKNIYTMRVHKKKIMVARKRIIYVQTERLVLSNIDHPLITSLRFAFQNKNKLYVITDFIQGKELFFYLKNEGRFSMKRSRFYSAEILLALKYLHSKDIIYGDLRPENIYLDNDGHIKLTDFNFCKDSFDGDIIQYVFDGNVEYLAPEIIQKQSQPQCIEQGSDWWAFGVLLYEMMTGLPPFYNRNINIMYDKILHAPIPLPQYLRRDARSIFLGLLEKNPKNRLGCSELGVVEIEQHSFYKEIDWNKLYKKEVKPPFKPRVNGHSGESCVDEEFTEELPTDVFHEPLLAKDVFVGFTI